MNNPCWHSRTGFSRIELAICAALAIVCTGIALPFLLKAREAARRVRCQENLRIAGTALHSYHDTHNSFPPAAVWLTTTTGSLSLHTSRQFDRFIRTNWALLLLPHTSESSLATFLRADLPICAPENEVVRTSSLAWQTCPSDSYNRPDNSHVFEASSRRNISFARGNYALNGGSNCFRREKSSTASVIGDPENLLIDGDLRLFQLWGNGIAGFNQAFRMQDFVNGASTLVALDEIRSGIHPIDPRGAWALGHFASSVTYGHGINGDDYGPNNRWHRSDDIFGCARLHDAVGSDTLAREGMPCTSYIDANQNATSRSMHSHGVNVIFVDGSVRFVSDAVDPGLWHAMHSRETPRGVFHDFESQLTTTQPASDASPGRALRAITIPQEPLSIVSNSIGMELVLLPAGEFLMGRPDLRNDFEIPPESPPHRARLTGSFYMGRHEVTRQDYSRVMAQDDGSSASETASNSESQFPVVEVSWFEADAFCRKLSGLPEERFAGREYRLPTEAEWEYACRAGSNVPYEWNRDRQPEDDSGEAGGIRPPLPISPVGKYRQNQFGLFDMRGNAWEWCADWFDRGYYRRSPVDDPQGPATGFLKVVRGGDWIYVGERCKINYSIMPPWNKNPYVGFRVVCSLTREKP